MFYYKSRKDDSEVIAMLTSWAERKPTRGFWYYYGRIRGEGRQINHKRLKRVYNLLKLNQRRRHKKRLVQRVKQPLEAPRRLNESWTMDFMHDSTVNGHKFRVLNLMDEYNREALAIEIERSLGAERVKQVLEQTIAWRGKPVQIRVDNGPEFISAALQSFCEQRRIKLQYIQPGKPMQNGFIERFNRSFREDVLDAYLFENLNEARELAYDWMDEYNQYHPHSSLNGKSPIASRGTVNSLNSSNKTLEDVYF